MAQHLTARAAHDAVTRENASAAGLTNGRIARRRRHHAAGRRRSTLRQLDRRALERTGWRTTLEFRENHVRLETGQLVDVEPFWLAEAERNGVVIGATARSESRAWSTLHRAAADAEQDAARDFFAGDIEVATP